MRSALGVGRMGVLREAPAEGLLIEALRYE